MKSRYEFHPEMGIFSKIHFPSFPAALPVEQKAMEGLYSLQHSGRHVHVSRFFVSSGDHRIRCLLYRKKGTAGKVPCILFLHGGGFVYNAAPYHFSLARRLTEKTGFCTVFADYRLAPGHPFPCAVHDCRDVYLWLLAHADDCGIDPERITVMGDSAGGNLAAVICRMALESGITMPKCQMLFYPVLDRRMNTESYCRFTDTPMLSSRSMEHFYAMYDQGGSNEKRVFLSPLEADSFAGLPPAYIEVAEFDCLHDEGVAYAKALHRAGVTEELYEIGGVPHGYDIASGSSLMKKIMKKRTAFLKKEG